ncbi:carboxylesterase family protein, partial [Microbacterium paraoxydans]|uniref:carboxylesterase family protein n=1 Tax=Microbacterium paraoxydans TaxID=199592 RepID=UPI0021A34EAD
MNVTSAQPPSDQWRFMYTKQASEVTAHCGLVRGQIEGGVHVFRGIRYALSPTGARRFAPPVAVTETD